jgi:hypothetical protein
VSTTEYHPPMRPQQRQGWHCRTRRMTFNTSGSCHCARFEDGTCVPPETYPAFAARRDAGLPFRSRDIYQSQEAGQ